MLSTHSYRFFSFFLLIAALTGPVKGYATTVFINEFHYDNYGTDLNEGVELIGTAGIDLQGWSLAFYNGSNGATYAIDNLSGIIPDQSNGYGTLFFAHDAMQNGVSDGIALVDENNTVLQFLSYEGTLVATNGPALGLTSVDVGLIELATTPAGQSLQLVGNGSQPADFNWQLGAQSFGSINTGQNITPVPVPAALPLFASAIIGLLIQRRSRH
jgi:hypothetical protein